MDLSAESGSNVIREMSSFGQRSRIECKWVALAMSVLALLLVGCSAEDQSQSDAGSSGDSAASTTAGRPTSTTAMGGEATTVTTVAGSSTSTSVAPSSPPTTATSTSPEEIAGQVTVADSFCAGTWQRSAMSGGAWGCQGAATAEGVAWTENGAELDYVCSTPGGSYTVRFAGGSTQTWSWWLQLDNGNYVRSAAMQQIDVDGPYGPQC